MQLAEIACWDLANKRKDIWFGKKERKTAQEMEMTAAYCPTYSLFYRWERRRGGALYNLVITTR
jgi:hypothetical protein